MRMGRLVSRELMVVQRSFVRPLHISFASTAPRFKSYTEIHISNRGTMTDIMKEDCFHRFPALRRFQYGNEIVLGLY